MEQDKKSRDLNSFHEHKLFKGSISVHVLFKRLKNIFKEHKNIENTKKKLHNLAIINNFFEPALLKIDQTFNPLIDVFLW